MAIIKQKWWSFMKNCINSKEKNIEDLVSRIFCLENECVRLNRHRDYIYDSINIFKIIAELKDFKIIDISFPFHTVEEKRIELEKDGYIMKRYFPDSKQEVWIKDECRCQKDEDK